MKQVYFVGTVGTDPAFAQKREALLAVAAEANWSICFPLERHSSFDLKIALADMEASSVVFADVSLERPSCYFEIGLAQAIGVPTVVVAQSGTQLHQFAGRDQVRYYNDLGEYAHAFRLSLQSEA